MSDSHSEMQDFYRVGLDLMKASLDNAERLQQQQLAAMRCALDEQSKSFAALSEAMLGYWMSQVYRGDRPPSA